MAGTFLTFSLVAAFEALGLGAGAPLDLDCLFLEF